MNKLIEKFQKELSNIYGQVYELKKEIFSKYQETFVGTAPDYTQDNKEKRKGKKPNFDLLNKLYLN